MKLPLLLLTLLPLVGCVSVRETPPPANRISEPSPPPERSIAEQRDVIEAVVRHFASTYGPPEQPRLVFLTLGQPQWGPTGDFLRRFDNDPLKVRPIGQGLIRGPLLQDKETLELGVALYIETLSFPSPNHASVHVAWHEGFGDDAPPSSDDHVYCLNRVNGAWTILSPQTTP